MAKKKKEKIHPYCQRCLKEHKGRWYVKKSKVYCKDPGGNEDIQVCSMIKEEMDISKTAEKEFTKDEIDFANMLYNPAIWTEVELKWTPRWYQDCMLKCLSGDQKVFMADGSVKYIEDIKSEDRVVSYNETKRTTPINTVKNKWYSGEKNIYKIILENGDTLECTDDHPILSHYYLGKNNKLFNKKSLKTDYVSIKDGLSVGDKVYTLNKFDRFGCVDDKDLAKILGYLVSDSYINFKQHSSDYNKNIVEFCNTNKKYIDEFYSLIKSRFSDCKIRVEYIKDREYQGNKKKEFWKVVIQGINNSLYKFLIDNNISNKYNREVNIFKYSFKFSKSSLKLFLNRAYAGDGSISDSCDNAQITYCSEDKNALNYLRILLKKIGIFSSHIYGNKNNNGVILAIRRADDCALFVNEVGSVFGKEYKSNSILKIYDRVYKNREHFKVGKFSNSTRTKIIDIELLGKKRTYDIKVENRNNFIAEGVIVHNCTAFRKVSRCGRRIGKTEAISIKMLHHAYTHEGETILVIAPYKNQVGLIFDKIDNFLGKSKSLQASIKRNTKNPYRVEFHNGSKILGFTSGTRTGSKSTGIRGQDAHVILIDEADYLSPSDFEVILAIQASRPDVEVWCSSTPTGKREMFWRFCTDYGLGYKEFHFPSSVSPSWTKQTERLERAQYSDQGYTHEFEAEFGEEAEGVFLNKFIDQSIVDYNMNKLQKDPTSIYTIGVDWNTSGNGTVILVMEWSKKLNNGRGAFRPVRKHIIGQTEFTQVRACEDIIRMNEEWNPSAIYVDQGFGHTQIEMLRKYGLENPKTGLANKVKGIYFGDKMEIRDPITKQKVKKHMKPFIVNLAVRRLEDGYIILPASEDIKNGLIGQIRDYTVIRTTALGQPVYSDEGDHTLVAWMLGIFAATVEFSDITKQNRAYNVGIAGKFGERKDNDFILNKKEIESEKRKRKSVIPRWHKPRMFQDRSLKNNVEYLKRRSRTVKKEEKRSKRFNRKHGDLLKSRSNY